MHYVRAWAFIRAHAIPNTVNVRALEPLCAHVSAGRNLTRDDECVMQNAAAATRPHCPFGSAWCLVCEVCRLGRLG